MKEALGQTSDESEYVYLSDGGHFENLGLYEMVRRRCRTIVVLDGGCDPDFHYDDLGNALRKIRIDLRIPIDFDDARRARCEDVRSGAQSGRSATPRWTVRAPTGTIVYVKPMLLRQRGARRRELRSGPSGLSPSVDRRPVVRRVPDRELPAARAATIDEMCVGLERKRPCRLLPAHRDRVPPARGRASGSRTSGSAPS